jgi:HEAT repeat protein
MGATEAVPRLVALLNAPEAPLAARRAVVQALASIPGQASVDAITLALSDPALLETALDASRLLADVALEPAVVRSRTEQLLRAGSSSPQAAIDALEALLVLARRVDDAALTLQAVSTSVDDPETRALAVEFLEELGEPDAVPLILRAGDIPQAASALESLGGGAVSALLAALEGEQQEAAAAALAAQGPGVARALMPMLSDPRLARAAARSLVEIGQQALPPLVTALESADAEALPGPLQVLGQIAPGRLANYVATFLDRPEPPVRYAALAALGNLPDPRSETELLARIDSPEPAEATLATLALGRIQSADAFEVLSRRVGQGDRRSQYALAGALNEYNLRQAPVLEMVRRMVREGLPVSSAALESAFTAQALADDDIITAVANAETPETQKLRLIGAVGRLDGELAIQPLLALLRSNPPEPVLTAAARALARHEVRARDSIADLVLDEATRDAGLHVLAEMQDARALMSVLRQLSPELEADAALRAALRGMGDLVLGPLIDVINENWDLESLALLWQLTEVVEAGTQ